MPGNLFLLARVVTLAGEDANAPRLIDRDIMLSVNGDAGMYHRIDELELRDEEVFRR